MVASIAQFLNKLKKPRPQRTPSDAANSSSTEMTEIDKGAEAGVEEKITGAPPVVLAASRQTNDTSINEGENAVPSPFEGGSSGGPVYESQTWWVCAVNMVASTISLGIMGLPGTLVPLGLIPGIISMLVNAAATWYYGIVIWKFKKRYPKIHNMGDAGRVLFGKWGEIFFGGTSVLFLVFIMASHLVAGSKAIDILSNHNTTCAIAWTVIMAFVSAALTTPRTLKDNKWASIPSVLSILVAIFIVMVDVGIRRPGLETIEGLQPDKYTLWGNPDATLVEKVSAFTTIMFAFSGSVAFIPFMSELEYIDIFPKALKSLMIFETATYVAFAVTVYVCVGNLVMSPAIDNASSNLRKDAWGAAMGTILIAGVLTAHVAAKQITVTISRESGRDLLHQTTALAWACWLGPIAALWIIAFILAKTIPMFEDMLGISGAIFASLLTFGLPGCFWFEDHFQRTGCTRCRWRKFRTRGNTILCGLNFLFIVGAVCAVSTSGGFPYHIPCGSILTSL